MRETVPRALEGERVDRAIALLTGLPRREAAELVDSGGVLLAGRQVKGRAVRVGEGDVLELELPERHAPSIDPDASVEVDVVHADPHVIVVDKPAGLVVHPGAGRTSGTLVNGLVARFPEIVGVGEPNRPGIVHRLDAGTSGLLVVARTSAAYASLVAQLSARTVERRYLALAWGHPDADAGLIDAPVGRGARNRTRMAVSTAGRSARTRYEVLRRFDDPAAVALLECRLETGRTHQIRVHLAAIGHPLVGDAAYGGARQALRLRRPFLHAHQLAYEHPATGKRSEHRSPLAPDLEELHDRLR